MEVKVCGSNVDSNWPNSHEDGETGGMVKLISNNCFLLASVKMFVGMKPQLPAA